MNKETLIGQLGLRLSSARWLPEGEPKAVVVLVHGYREHIGRYLHVMEALNKGDYVVFTLDHRGHGESEGQRACVEKFAYFVDDLPAFFNRFFCSAIRVIHDATHGFDNFLSPLQTMGDLIDLLF